ncbi:MAG: hypothetical protein WC891_02235 [Actinomycetota bacterium]
MISGKLVAALLLGAGLIIFMIPQSLPRRWLDSWPPGLSFAFWMTRLVALTMIAIGFIGIIAAK